MQRNQDASHVLRNVQRNNIVGQNNITTIVEAIVAQNGFNMGLHLPTFVSPFSEFIRQTELHRGCKVPKFTKFSGETNEFRVIHVARYQCEAGDTVNNKNLKMKYFPSSLTKNLFTWFMILPPNFIHTWSQLEKIFHEEFHMGQSKISLKELANVKETFLSL